MNRLGKIADQMQVRILPDSLIFDDIGREVNAGRPVWLLKVRGLPRPLQIAESLFH